MTLGERMKYAREAAELSVRGLAELSGVGKSTIVDYESDLHEPRLFTMALLADILEVSIDWLAGRTEEGGPK